jgi:hypothetical protein
VEILELLKHIEWSATTIMNLENLTCKPTVIEDVCPICKGQKRRRHYNWCCLKKLMDKLKNDSQSTVL